MDSVLPEVFKFIEVLLYTQSNHICRQTLVLDVFKLSICSKICHGTLRYESGPGVKIHTEYKVFFFIGQKSGSGSSEGILVRSN